MARTKNFRVIARSDQSIPHGSQMNFISLHSTSRPRSLKKLSTPITAWTRRWGAFIGGCVDALVAWLPTWRWRANWRCCSTGCCVTGWTTSRKDSKNMKPKYCKLRPACSASSPRSKALFCSPPLPIELRFMVRKKTVTNSAASKRSQVGAVADCLGINRRRLLHRSRIFSVQKQKLLLARLANECHGAPGEEREQFFVGNELHVRRSRCRRCRNGERR